MFETTRSPDPDGAIAPSSAVDASLVERWATVLAGAELALDDAARVDLLAALERLKCTAEGVQAVVAADFEDSQRARAAACGVPAERRGRGIAEQVALARRESPHRGRRHLGLARALREELTCTGAALRSGHITEYRAGLIATETSHLATEDRMIVDATLAADPERLAAMGDRETAAAARRLAAELDVESACRRRRRAETERCVTIRLAPDTMTWVSALLPVKDGVALYAALRQATDTATAQGDPRSRGQLMADTLCARVAGQPDTDGGFEARCARTSTSGPRPRVSLNLVMTDRALLAGEDEAGWLEGFGPVPADLARKLVGDACDAGDRVWLRRLYTHPGTGELVAMDSRQRLFRNNLARLIRLRDRTCRTPWCDAPIRQADHAQEARTGGPTSAENGQGLCHSCNLAKQAPGWTSARAPAPGHQIQTTTPTGHTYHSRAPALARPPYRQTRPDVWTLTA